MQHIIISKKKYNDNDLVLQSISEDNQFHDLRVPGILKSNKRSSYFFIPGAIWEFYFSSSHLKYKIPKEMDFCYVPYTQVIDYNDMKDIQDLLSPITVFRYHKDIKIFDKIKDILIIWENSSHDKKQYLRNYFSLLLLKNIGILDLELTCKICNKSIQNSLGYLHIGFGNVCEKCSAYKTEMVKNIRIPHSWIKVHIRKFSGNNQYRTEYSNLINEYILRNYKQ